MATLKKSALHLGPSPWSDEPSVEAHLSLSADELARITASPAALAKAAHAHITPPALEGADVLACGRFVAELARALLNECSDTITTAGARPAAGGVLLTLGFRHPKASVLALETAARLALGADRAAPAEVAKAIEAFWKQAQPFMPDPQATLLLRGSARRGVPVRLFDASLRLWLHGWGARSEVMFEASPRGDSRAGWRVSSDKSRTKPAAVAAGFRVLPSVLVRDPSQLDQVARAIGFPCVAKPTEGFLSKGVTVGITDLAGLRAAHRVAQEQSKGPVLVERYAQGEPYRLMVQRGKLWKAILRPRPSVVGDGTSTVEQLAKARNASLNQVVRPFSITRPTPLDSDFLACLRRQGLAPASVPAAGAKVLIRDIPLLSKGATGYRDMADRAHPDVRLAAERLARILGVESLGIDFMTPDISRQEDAYFLEANLTPELRLLGMAGLDEAEVAQGIIGDKAGRIPSALVIAPRSEHARILALASRPGSQGWTDGRQVGIGGSVFPTGVQTPHDGVDLLVRNPAVESLLVVCDPADITSAGLPLDKADRIAVVEGATLPAEWDALLRRCANQVETVPVDRALG